VTDVWTTIVVLAVATAAIRAVGPVLVGARELSDPVVRVITLLAPALLAALIAVGTFTEADGELVLDARAAGLAAAAAVLAWRHKAMLSAALAAGLVASLVRAIA
jgi:branched-subunit amino acid transport protein